MKTALLFILGLFLFIMLVSKIADYETIRCQGIVIEAYDEIIDDMDDDYFLDVVSEADAWNEVQYYTEKLSN